MAKKQQPSMLGYNKEGLELGSKLLAPGFGQILGFAGALVGLFFLFFLPLVGVLLVAGGLLLLYYSWKKSRKILGYKK